MIINATHSVFSVIKMFSQHKLRKSFTHVNLVDKSAMLVKKVDIKLLDNNCCCCELPSSGSHNTFMRRHREASITEMLFIRSYKLH